MVYLASELETKLKIVKERISSACQRAGRQPEEVSIMAVTKGFPPQAIIDAHRLGIRHFGENRVQEARVKLASLPPLSPRLTWHMVGHLQTNKAKLALELFDVMHSVDSLKLAEFLSHLCQKRLPVFLEINTSGESTKMGFRPEDSARAMEYTSKLDKLEVKGLMTIALVVRKAEEARPYFRLLKKIADSLGLKELSMGMSDDFEIAVEEGATMIRIGRALFGERREE